MEPPAGADVRTELERVLASRAFAGSARLRAFLRYVVERTLAGEGAELKEYAIGVDVFERDAQYDPRIDSIVRVEAGRLRAKLEEYYGAEGTDSRITLQIPRGGYAPVFVARAPVAAETGTGRSRSAPAWTTRFQLAAAAALVLVLAAVAGLALTQRSGERPSLQASRPSTDISVAVLPFTHYAPAGADAVLAARLTDAVTTELARLNVVGVVSRTTALQLARAPRPLPELARLANATAAIEGSVLSEGGIVRVRTRIVDGRIDLKTDVRDFSGPRNDPDALARRIADALSATFKARSLR